MNFVSHLEVQLNNDGERILHYFINRCVTCQIYLSYSITYNFLTVHYKEKYKSDLNCKLFTLMSQINNVFTACNAFHWIVFGVCYGNWEHFIRHRKIFIFISCKFYWNWNFYSQELFFVRSHRNLQCKNSFFFFRKVPHFKWNLLKGSTFSIPAFWCYPILLPIPVCNNSRNRESRHSSVYHRFIL